ncbi:MAG: hypothetical protein WBK20_09045 [Spirochaetota bacterium]
MKNKILQLFIIIATIMISAKAFSLDLNVGATLWYANWEPHWEQEFRDIFRDQSGEVTHFKMDDTYLIGPIVSFRLGDTFSLTANMLYGKYTASCIKMWYEGGTRSIYSTMDITKYDTDIILNYKAFTYVQFFIGFKLQHYNLSETQRVVYNTLEGPVSRDLLSNSYGLGLGVGFTIPLDENFAMLLNIAGIYLRTEVEDSWQENSGANPPSYIYTLNAYGINNSLSLAYFLPSYNITLLTGFRYQYLKYKQADVQKTNYDPGDEFRFDRDYNNQNDIFWGINISVIYSFSL